MCDAIMRVTAIVLLVVIVVQFVRFMNVVIREIMEEHGWRR